jgi:hypothetical protein
LDTRTGKRITVTVHHGFRTTTCAAPQLITVYTRQGIRSSGRWQGRLPYAELPDRRTFVADCQREVPRRPAPGTSLADSFSHRPLPFTRSNVTTNDTNPYFSRKSENGLNDCCRQTVCSTAFDK